LSFSPQGRIAGAESGADPLGTEHLLWIVAVLFLVWLAVVRIGAVIKGLFRHTVVAAVRFFATAVWCYLQRRSKGRSLH
jgi:hypothetical protein